MMITADDAEGLLIAEERATVDLCAAIRAECAATDACSKLLASLTNRLLGERNPTTGRAHSGTSARDAARRSEAYQIAQRSRLDAECARVTAASTLERLTLAARMAVAAVEANGHPPIPDPR